MTVYAPLISLGVTASLRRDVLVWRLGEVLPGNGSLLTRDTGAAYHIIGLGSTIFTGRVVAAVGISGPIWRVSLERAAGLARTVSAAAGRLSEHLGGRRGGTEDAPALPEWRAIRARRAPRPAASGGRA